jgi:NAD(P)-dependent dehydrogenase (short-subunit alcohol dehydrogenase family)
MPKQQRGFQDAVTVVIGGTSGIGRATASLLARRGARVWIGGRNQEAVDATLAELNTLGSTIRGAKVDVTSRESVATFIDAVCAEAGHVDHFFNFAGDALLAYLEETSPEQWRHMIDVNLMGIIHGVDAVYPRMKKRGSGHIVNASSLAGLVPLPASAAYCASKYGAVGLSQALRVEGAAFGVRVSVVCPAAVKTPLFQRATYVGFDPRVLEQNPPPGGFMDPAACADEILVGVARNVAVITPGPATQVWRMSRLLPSLWSTAARSFGRKLADARLK